MVLSGILGSILAGIALDRTKRYETLAKLSFVFVAVWNILIVVLLNFTNDHAYIYGFLMLSFCLLGFFALPLLPICFESVVECTYPLSESTSTGLLFITGQLTGIIMILTYPLLAQQIKPDSNTYLTIQTCTPLNSTQTSSNLDVLDYKIPLFGQIGLLLLVAVLFNIFFKCRNQRLNSEKN